MELKRLFFYFAWTVSIVAAVVLNLVFGGRIKSFSFVASTLRSSAEELAKLPDLLYATTLTTDPSQTSRFTRLTKEQLAEFAQPVFEGCSATGICNYSNVCFGQQDGILIFETSPSVELNVSDFQVDYSNIGSPNLPRIVRYEELINLENVFHSERMFVTNCWRQSVGRTNPSHLFEGWGRIFTMSTGHYFQFDRRRGAVDTVLYQQCPVVQNWDLGVLFDNLVLDYAAERGIVSDGGSRSLLADARATLPFEGDEVALHNSTIVCGSRVHTSPFDEKLFFGKNKSGVVKEWRKWLDVNLKSDKSPKEEKHDLAGLCKKKLLKIALWRRTETGNPRRLVNEGDINDVAKEFSSQPLRIITFNSSTPALEQVDFFRSTSSFDILISPHGSQMANMIFSHGNVVIIEVLAIKNEQTLVENGREFVRKHIESVGHLTENPRLHAMMAECRRKTSKQCKNRLKNADLLVNTTILREDLQDAVNTLCGEFGGTD